MILKGTFYNVNQEAITVTITNSSVTHDDIKIGCAGEGCDVMFSEDPIEIDENYDSTFDNLYQKEGSLELVTSINLAPYLFAANHNSVTITITKAGNLIFSGFIEPNVYSQGYANNLENLTVTFTDFISTLQYRKLSQKYDNWTVAKQQSKTHPFRWYFEQLGFFDVGTVYIDRSATTTTALNVLGHTGISSALFLGDEEDDEMDGDEIIEEICKYYNLHLIQIGADFYIFNWQTIKDGGTIKWTADDIWEELNDDTYNYLTTSEYLVTTSDYASDDTQMSIDEVYNQIKVKCDIEDIETLIESPLDEDSMYSYYPQYVRFCDEFWSNDDNYFNRLVGMYYAASNCLNYPDSTSKYSFISNAHATHWLMKPMLNTNWSFKVSSLDWLKMEVQDIYPITNGKYSKQWYVGQYMSEANGVKNTRRLVASPFRIGKADSTTDSKSDTKIEYSDYLYMSINGNGSNDDTAHRPNDDDLEKWSNMCEYTGTKQGINLSPVSDETTNYIVFSGSFIYQPLAYEVGPNANTVNSSYYCQFRDGMMIGDQITTSGLNRQTFGDMDFKSSSCIENTGSSGDKSCMIMRAFWSPDQPSDIAMDETLSYKYTSYLSYTHGLIPPNEDVMSKKFKYNYNAEGTNTDKIKYLPIICCEMTVGNKRLVQTNIDDSRSSNNYKWVTDTAANRVQYGSYFTLGCNPEIGDYIIGQKYDFNNTVGWGSGVDAKGTAIPVTAADNLHGDINFKIVGPYNLVWDDVTRRHKTWFRSTKYSSNSSYILPYVQNIIIQDFECKVYTDQGDKNNDSDLIYMSDENHDYIKVNDDTEMKLNTVLTKTEADELGVENTINLSSVINTDSGSSATGIFFMEGKDIAKPEQWFVDSYYEEYHLPRLVIDSTLHDADWGLSPNKRFSKIKFNYFSGSDFYIISTNINLMKDTATLKMKQNTIG